MTYDDLRLLIDYNYWARDRVLDAVATITPEQFIRPMGNSFKSVRDTVAHICAAERILRKSAGTPETGPPSRCRRNSQGVGRTGRRDARSTRKIGAGSCGAHDRVSGPSRNDQSDVLWQMLQHVVNHGTYHRGQITTMLRQLDAAPPKSMDLIAFYRARNRKA